MMQIDTKVVVDGLPLLSETYQSDWGQEFAHGFPPARKGERGGRYF